MIGIDVGSQTANSSEPFPPNINHFSYCAVKPALKDLMLRQPQQVDKIRTRCSQHIVITLRASVSHRILRKQPYHIHRFTDSPLIGRYRNRFPNVSKGASLPVVVKHPVAPYLQCLPKAPLGLSSAEPKKIGPLESIGGGSHKTNARAGKLSGDGPGNYVREEAKAVSQNPPLHWLASRETTNPPAAYFESPRLCSSQLVPPHQLHRYAI